MTPARPRPSRRWHLSILGASCAVIAAAFLLQVRPDQRVTPRGLPTYPLPHTCSMRLWLGVNCPSCGLTRSFIHLAHGDRVASVRAHRLGWLLAALVVAQVPYRLWALSRRGRPLLGPRASLSLAIGLIALLVGNWLYNLWHTTGTGAGIF